MPVAALAQNVTAGLHFECDGIAYAVYDYSNPGRWATVTAREQGYAGNLTIPNSVYYNGVEYTVGRIDASAFSGQNSLLTLSLPTTISYIGKDAFQSCTGLQGVYITDLNAWCRTEFHDNPLRYAHKLYLNENLLIHLQIPADISALPSLSFYGAECLESVEFPASLTDIGASAFAMCTGLQQLTVPEPVSSIGASAFYHNTSLSKVWLPASLRELGSLAFAECTSLKEMFVSVPYGTMVTRGVQPFCYTPTASGTLHVPAGSLSTYRNQAAWGEWGTITETGKCATPQISFAAGRLTFTCETAEATIQASVSSDDFGTFTSEGGVNRTLTGLYTVQAQAGAPNMLISDVATAYVAWSLRKDPITGLEIPETDSALLITREGESLTLHGTEAGREILVYDLRGILLLRQAAEAGKTTLQPRANSFGPVIISYNNRNYKLWL